MESKRKRLRRITPGAMLAVLLLLAGAALATAADEGEVRELSTVVVTASGFEQRITEAPASISVITREHLETRQFRDLAEALADVEGIDVRGGTGKAGGFDISIRGMPSDYTLIMVDGRRQNVAGDVTPNGFGTALTSFMPPLSAIERIEVIRGPMSTLYGSDAMGGVVNIITRKVAPEWGGVLSLETGNPESSDYGATQKTSLYANGPIVPGVLGLALRGSIFRRAESDWVLAPGATAGGRNPAPAETRQYNIGGRLTLTPGDDHEFWLDAERGLTWYDNEECRLGTVDFINCTTGAANATASGYRDYMRFNRDSVAIGHSSKLSFGLLESSLMRTVTETLGRTIPTAARPAGDPQIGQARELETTNLVFDTKFVAPIGRSHVATVGGQWWNAELVDGLLPEDHDQTMWALFLEDEWRFTDSFAATFGARYDRHDAFGGEVSPRIYLVWNTTEYVTVKGGVSKGFKAPRLNQLIDGVSGIGGQGTSISIGNPNLKPETSINTELGVLFDNQRGLGGSVTLFHNQIDDKIGSGGSCEDNPISSCVANPAASYAINIDEAKTWGVEVAGRIPITQRWSLSMNYTWTDSEIEVDGRKNGKLSDTAEHMANAQLRWATTDKLNLWLRGEYRGKSRRFDGDPDNLTGNNLLEYQALGDLKDYTLFHLGGGYRVSESVTINANIFNLFDKDFRDFRSYENTAGDTVWSSEYFKGGQSVKGTTLPGRTYWISANISF